MPTSPNTLVQALTLFAIVAATVSLVIAVLFVHDRRQRLPALLLPVGIICSIIGPMFSDQRAEVAFLCVTIVLVVISTVLLIRLGRTQPD